MQMPADITEQTRNCFRTIAGVLQQAGFSLNDVVRAVYYVIDMTDADKVLAVCGEQFRDIRPAGTIIAVSALLRPEMRVEMEVTAKRTSK